MLRRLTPVIGAALLIALATPAEAIISPDIACVNGQVSITFDDGPSKINTPKLLKILRERNAQATFFVQGQHVKRQLLLTKQEIQRVTGYTPVLYRPPYGATSKRVRSLAKKQGLHEELWTIDTRDWSGRRSAAIRKAALTAAT